MKPTLRAMAVLSVLSCLTSVPASAQLAGEPFIHDPATITVSEGKYYTYGTGTGSLVSEDGWSWHSGAERPGRGLAPDVIKIGDWYYVAYAAGGGGMNGGHAGAIKVNRTKSLDPKSPNYSFEEVGAVATSDGVEATDAIDPAFLYVDGRLWLSYGTYYGYILLVELDPKTGQRLDGNQPVAIAIDMEATAMMFRDGWYYLLGTHGTCCDGPNSSYNIRVGRSRSVQGPYLDHMGIPLLRGGGKLVANGRGRQYGPGHFGLIELGDGVEKFSMHFEADLDRSGRSVLAIAPLLWKDGWPIEGENIKAGTYEIESERSGFALQLATDFVRIDFDRRSSFMAKSTDPVAPIPNQTLAQDSAAWPAGRVDVDLGAYMIRAHQQWTITPVPEAGGVMGTPYYKIVLAGTDRTLTAAANSEVEAAPAFTGAPEQMWMIDQLSDGTYRIMPRAAPGSKTPLALVAIGASTSALVRFDPKSEAGRWRFRTP